MPLELQTELPEPNAPLFPQILLTTSVGLDKKLHVSAQIFGAYGRVENYGQENESWQQLAAGQCAVVEDLLNLPEDLAELEPVVAQAWPIVVGLCQAINVKRKMV